MFRLSDAFAGFFRSPEGEGAAGGSPAPSSAPASTPSSAPSGSDASSGGGTSPTPASGTGGSPPPISPESFFDMPGQDEIDQIAGEFETDDSGEATGEPARDPATGRFLPKSGEATATPTPGTVPPAIAGAEPTPQPQPAATSEPAAGAGAAGAPTLAPDATLLEQMEFAEAEIIPHLAEMYSIPAAAAGSFTPEQQSGMKTLAATLHVNVMKAVLKNVQSEIPGMVNRMFQQQAARDAGEAEFFKAWPQLTKEDLPIIRHFGSIYARGNPKAPMGEFVSAVGAMAVTHLQRGFQAAPAQASVPQGGGHMAAAPPPANVRPVSHRPANVTPAAPNGGGQGAPRPAQGNAWEQYSNLWDAQPDT